MLTTWYPFLVLAVGLIVVIGGIVGLRLHAFLALIAAALVVSLLAPGAWSDKAVRVAEAFGSTAAGVGIVIALAAIIGAAMTRSGAADRIVAMFLGLLGEKRGPSVLMASGFTLSMPVFFDTVFYLLIPLVRSMYRRMRRSYVLLLMAAATATVAHVLVPPTPGPLIIAQTLGVDLGVMILFGCLVGLPSAITGLWFAKFVDRRMPEMAPPEDADADAPLGEESGDERTQPGLGMSFAPIALPIVLITLNTAVGARMDLATVAEGNGAAAILAAAIVVLGNPNIALLLSAATALVTLAWCRRESLGELAATIEHALLSGGMIVLITAAGGAFGGMLRAAGLAEAVQQAFGDHAVGGLGFLLLAFLVAALIRFAQGSSTASMIVTSAMFAAMLSAPGASESLGYHPVYLALAIGSGSLVLSWMNDSGFWIFSRMGGLTEAQTLRTWTPLLTLLGSVAMALTLLLAIVVPGAFGLP